jgi:hypothetical protein
MKHSTVYKEKEHASYSSIMHSLIRDGYFDRASKNIPLDFIQKEAIRIREKRSSLSSDIRAFILSMAAIDTITKVVEAQREVEEKEQTDKVVMMGGQ